MTEVFLLTGRRGRYDEEQTWPVRVFATAAEAEAHQELCAQHAGRNDGPDGVTLPKDEYGIERVPFGPWEAAK